MSLSLNGNVKHSDTYLVADAALLVADASGRRVASKLLFVTAAGSNFISRVFSF